MTECKRCSGITPEIAMARGKGSYRLLITGAGRSGTTYMTEVLRRIGLDVQHERLGKDGTVSSFFCFDVGSYPGPRPQKRPHFDLVLHQVRHPIPAISSIMTGRTWEWSCQFLPVDVGAPIIERAAHTWLVWNLEAECQAKFTYRIEDLEYHWETLQQFIGFDNPYSDVADIPKNANTREHDMVTWPQLEKSVPDIYEKIRLTALRYGYTL